MKTAGPGLLSGCSEPIVATSRGTDAGGANRRRPSGGHTTMQLKQLLTEDRAVSPVIGVILMVAITVILAAVIGTFVLGLGQNVQSTPQASFSFDFGNNGSAQVVNVTHNGGDRLEEGDNTGTVAIAGGVSRETWIGGGSNTTITAGDTYPGYAYNSGDNIRVVWTGTNNESSATLGQQEAPA